MPEQTEHTERARTATETTLGTAVLQIATVVEAHAEDEAEREAAAALAIPHTHGAMAIAAATDRLLTRIEGLAVGIARVPVGHRGDGVLARWETLKAKGPAGDPLGTWSYMRDLAHITRDMVRVLRERRVPDQPEVFVGRPGLPPVAPGAP